MREEKKKRKFENRKEEKEKRKRKEMAKKLESRWTKKNIKSQTNHKKLSIFYDCIIGSAFSHKSFTLQIS